MELDAANSGVIQVGDANALGQLTKQGITAKDDGFFYTYVTNQSAGKVNFDNMTIVHWAPVVRVVYDYYPYGLTWENPKLPADPDAVHDHCYQDKEFQFAEFTTGHGLALYDFHARMYDPCTARWLVPDPAAQFANPYLAMGNSPVMMTDPNGEWVNFVIGAVAGGIAGYQIGKANGAEGGKMLAYVIGGAAIGLATAGIGTAITSSLTASAAVGSSIGAGMIGGAAAGAFSGAAMTAMAGGSASDIVTSALYGAVSAGVGGIVGAQVGGLLGAMAGGATSGAVGVMLAGGSSKQAGRAALAGAAVGAVAYEINMVASYAAYSKVGVEANLNFLGYHQASANIQRSTAWNREFGWYETESGFVRGTTMGAAGGGSVPMYDDPLTRYGKVEYISHTHVNNGAPGFNFHGPTDISVQKNINSKVYGWNTIHEYRYDSSRYFNDKSTMPARPAEVTPQYMGRYFNWASGRAFATPQLVRTDTHFQTYYYTNFYFGD